MVEHAGTLYFGGIGAEDLGLDMAGQARDVLRQLDALLLANGYSAATQQILFGVIILIVALAYGREARLRDQV